MLCIHFKYFLRLLVCNYPRYSENPSRAPETRLILQDKNAWYRH